MVFSWLGGSEAAISQSPRLSFPRTPGKANQLPVLYLYHMIQPPSPLPMPFLSLSQYNPHLKVELAVANKVKEMDPFGQDLLVVNDKSPVVKRDKCGGSRLLLFWLNCLDNYAFQKSGICEDSCSSKKGDERAGNSV